jgi:hypothetical protein
MQPTVFASFTDPAIAERMVGALLEAGVAPEDISVVVKGEDRAFFEGGAGELGESGEGLALVDASESHTSLFGSPRVETEGSYTYESRIGGGISTSSSEDSVSGVEEMDESQEAAEQMSYPASASSYSSNEDFDVSQGANTGFFNTTKPGPEGLGSQPDVEPLVTGESDLTSLHVPGLGTVIGDGALATEVIGAGMATERGGNPAATMQDYLIDQAISRDQAWLLANDFEQGGAVLSVAVPPGTLDADAIQQVLENIGARNVQFVEQGQSG